MQKTKDWSTIWSFVAVCMVAVLALGMGFGYGNPTAVDEDKLAKDIAAKIDVSAGVTLEEIEGLFVATDNEKIDEMYDDMFADNIKEALAEELVLDEVDSRDFRKAVWEALDGFDGQMVDDYRDITNIVIKDTEVELIGDEDAAVTIEAKVYYFIDGDDEEKARAKVEVTINVEELVEDDDYEDAEVDEDYTVDVVKVYD